MSPKKVFRYFLVSLRCHVLGDLATCTNYGLMNDPNVPTKCFDE